jgi:cytoskeletal protein CcmA (bactofilin family)
MSMRKPRLAISHDPQVQQSVLARGVRIHGTVHTEGLVRIEGTVDGDVRAGGQVLVAPGGFIEGDVVTRHAVVGGEVRGQILAETLVEIRSGGAIRGNVVTPRIAVEEGGTVNGMLRTAQPPDLTSLLRAPESGKAEVEAEPEAQQAPADPDIRVLRSAR